MRAASLRWCFNALLGRYPEADEMREEFNMVWSARRLRRMVIRVYQEMLAFVISRPRRLGGVEMMRER